MENNNAEVKVMTKKEKKDAQARADWERTRNLTYDEMVKEKRGKAKRRVLGVVTVVTTCVAAFGAGRQAAVNKYKKALASTPEVPDTGKEFTPANSSRQESFNPGPTCNATTVETNSNNE